MQILSSLILQFIFIYLSLIIGVPGTDQYNILKNKLVLFSGIFIFQTLIKSISKARSGCKVSLKNLLVDSFFISTLSIVGYSFYIDLSLIDSTKHVFKKFSNDPSMSSLAISSIITALILFVTIIQFLVKGSIDECEEENEIY